jgi:hypothetical protein
MTKINATLIALLISAPLSTTSADNLLTYGFDAESRLNWAYFSDQVMGGVSEGTVDYIGRKWQQLRPYDR